MFRSRTNKGRIVYERKKHEFTVRDLERITGQLLEKRRSVDERRDFVFDIEPIVKMLVEYIVAHPSFGVSAVLLVALFALFDTFETKYCDRGKFVEEPSFRGGGASRVF